MHLRDFLDQIQAETPFIRRLEVAQDGALPSPIHPIVTISEYILHKAISENFGDPLALIFPYKKDVAKWISVLSVLRLMKLDYESGRILDYDFKTGQNLLYNNEAVVEFDCFDDNQMWVKLRDACESRLNIPISRILQLQPTSRTRLSSITKVQQVRWKSRTNQLDNILDIKSFGNYQLFETNIILVDTVGSIENTIKCISVNGKRLDELFAWGKLSRNGKLSFVRNYANDCKPSSIIAPDLYSVCRFLESENHNTKAIIVSDSSFCRNDPHSLAQLQDSRTPMLLVSDLNQIDDLAMLAENSFRMCVWSNTAFDTILSVKNFSNDSVFGPFNCALKNYSRQNVEPIHCKYPELDAVINKLKRFEQLLRTIDDPEARSIFSSLFQKCNEFSRLIRVPSPDWLKAFTTSIQDMRTDFMKRQLWVSPELISDFSDTVDKILEITEPSLVQRNIKITHFEHLFKQSDPAEKKLVVVSKDTDVEPSKEYWQNRLKNSTQMSNLTFVAPGNVPQDFSFNHLIVCGWLGQSKMYTILHSYLASKVSLLAYEHENKWYKSALKRWAEQTRNIDNTSEDVASLLEVPADLFGVSPDSTHDVSYLTSGSEEDDFLEVERRIASYKYDAYKPSPSTQNESEKAKRISFSGENFAFFTKTHKCIVINELMRETPDAKIYKPIVNHLKVNDYLLFFDSDKDMIRENADKILSQEGKSQLREIASVWKLSLHLKLKKLGHFNALVSLLRQHGCEKDDATILNWLLNEEIIGPRSYKDLELIATATGNEVLNKNLSGIQEAISVVRGAHHRASSYLGKRLISALPKIINTDSQVCLPLKVTIPDFGAILILQVEEIDDLWIAIERHYINRLLKERHQ